jgi:hypothetical protein
MQFPLFALGLCVVCVVVGLLLSASIRLMDFAGNKICDMYNVPAAPAMRSHWLAVRFDRLIVALLGVAVLAGFALTLGRHAGGA